MAGYSYLFRFNTLFRGEFLPPSSYEKTFCGVEMDKREQRIDLCGRLMYFSGDWINSCGGLLMEFPRFQFSTRGIKKFQLSVDRHSGRC